VKIRCDAWGHSLVENPDKLGNNMQDIIFLAMTNSLSVNKVTLGKVEQDVIKRVEDPGSSNSWYASIGTRIDICYLQV
jgi:hypothetical protein